MDIIVTTPKTQMEEAKQEAHDCIRNLGGHYFRRFNHKPSDLTIGDKIFYVEDGYIRGFASIVKMESGENQCETTGKFWAQGWYVFLDSTTWQWIKPIPMKGFQGWRYFKDEYVIIGGWLDPKPNVS